jgi:hypothetical protein
MSPHVRSWWPFLLGVALFAAAVVLPLLREVGTKPWQTMWAEDGPIYYQQGLTGGVGSLLRGYSGYVQLLPRLLIQPLLLLPASWVAAAAAILGSSVAALLALFVYRSTRGWIATIPFRLAVPLMMVLAPALQWENTGNLVNLIWGLVAAVPWALVSRRTKPTDVGLRVVVVVLAALSQPLSAVFVPIAVLVWWRRRSRESLIVGLSFIAGLAAQAMVMVFAGGREASTPISVKELGRLISTEFVGSFVVGNAYQQLWRDLGKTFAVLAVVVTMIVFAVAWVGATRPARRLSGVLLYAAGVTAVLPLLTNRTPIPLVEGQLAGNGGRYIVLPVIMIVGALTVLLDFPDASRNRTVAVVGRWIFAVQLLVLVVLGFRVASPRGLGPQWTTQVRAAEAICNDPRTPAGTVVSVGTAPPGWSVSVTCAQLPDP